MCVILNSFINFCSGQLPPARGNNVLPAPRSSLPGGATLTAGPAHRIPLNLPRTGPNLTITPSVTITPTSAPQSGMKSRNVSCCNVFDAIRNFLKILTFWSFDLTLP